MLRLILIRHGETERNSLMRLQGGKSDTPLNDKGREQALRLGLALKDKSLEAIYSSPLDRALTTAMAIAAHHYLEIQTDEDLTEINMGDIDGLNVSEVMEKHNDFWKQWRQGDGLLTLPGGGESMAQVQQRAWSAIQRIMQHHKDSCIAVVSHAIAIQTIIRAALGAPLVAFPRFNLGVASITILHLDARRTSLVTLNDTCHLENKYS